MTPPDDRWIGLIRGIGPTTHAVMSMADLRTACARAGLADVRTLLSTGNVLFRSQAAESELIALLADILAHFGLDNPVVVRQPAQIAAVIADNPWPEVAAQRPHHLLVQFLGHPVDPTAAQNLADWAGAERAHAHGRAIYVDYVDGVGTSALTPARLERLAGVTGTARNWNTTTKLLSAWDR